MKHTTAARRVATLGIFLALALVLSLLEGLVPPIPGLPPNSKLGLSNIVVMYTLFFLGAPSAITLAVLKALFVLLTRGAAAGFLSLSGGLLSAVVLVLLTKIGGGNFSLLLLSIFGAIAHDTGQLLAARVLFQDTVVLLYLPAVLLVGVGMGAVTGALLRLVLPALERLPNEYHKEKQ